MNQSFSTLDYVVFILYGLLIIGVGLWVSREKKGHKKKQLITSWQVNLCPGGLLVPHLLLLIFRQNNLLVCLDQASL